MEEHLESENKKFIGDDTKSELSRFLQEMDKKMNRIDTGKIIGDLQNLDMEMQERIEKEKKDKEKDKIERKKKIHEKLKTIIEVIIFLIILFIISWILKKIGYLQDLPDEPGVM